VTTKAEPPPTRVLLVDDEEPARVLLREVLGAIPGVSIVGEAANGFEAVRAASEETPDVAFLDIEMPKLSGFEVAELLPPEVAVVFVTAYDKYALRAFEVHAVDYVLKPYREDRLREALERARSRAASSSLSPLSARPDPSVVAAAARPEGSFAERVAIRDGPHVEVIPVEKVDFLEAQDDAVVVRTGKRRLWRSQTLASLAATLDPSRFVRVHRSYVVNLERIARIERYAKNSHIAILADGSRVPVSRDGYAKLKEHLDGTRRG
jgi:two-component system LytT family response regulator